LHTGKNTLETAAANMDSNFYMGECVALTTESMRRRTDALVVISGFILLVDTVWGGKAALGLDLSRTSALVMGMSLVLGFPAYLLDLWIDKKIAVSMLALFVFRGIAMYFGGATQVGFSLWHGNVLLIVGFVFLQLSKHWRYKAHSSPRFSDVGC
jgi:hypothetical protein